MKADSKERTNRDNIAIKAMEVLIDADEGYTIPEAKKDIGLADDTEYDPKTHWPRLVALRAYRYADAMIDESNK